MTLNHLEQSGSFPLLLYACVRSACSLLLQDSSTGLLNCLLQFQGSLRFFHLPSLFPLSSCCPGYYLSLSLRVVASLPVSLALLRPWAVFLSLFYFSLLKISWLLFTSSVPLRRVSSLRLSSVPCNCFLKPFHAWISKIFVR